MKADSFIGLVQVNRLLLQKLTQILVLRYNLPQNRRLLKYEDHKYVETSTISAIFSM